MRRMKYFVAPWAMLLSCLAAGQAASAPEAKVSLQQKVAVAVARDLRLAADDPLSRLQILAPPGMSLPDSAELHVIWVRAGFARGTRLLRLGCAARSDCMAFHVLLRATPLQVRKPATAEALPATGTRQIVAPLAHSGDRMFLVEDRPGMRLQARVVCLQTGALGDLIRVRNLASHRVLLATIASKDEVRVE